MEDFSVQCSVVTNLLSAVWHMAGPCNRKRYTVSHDAQRL